MKMDVSELTGIWDYSTLPTNIRVGSGCFLERRDSFHRYRSEQEKGLILGNNVSVYTWTQFNIDPNGSEEIDGDSTNFELIEDEVITIQSDGANWWIL